MSWTNDVIIEFIELYRREPILWNPKHEHYKVKFEVSSAWSRIQSNLSKPFSVLDLKKKKESLMTTFRLHCSKKRSLPEFKSTWFAFTHLESFLGTRYECDNTNDSDNKFSTVFYYSPTKECADSEKPNYRNIRSKSKRVSDYSSKNEPEDSLPITRDSIESRRGEKEQDEYDLYGQLLAKKLRKLDEHQRDIAMHEIDNIMFRTKMQNRNSRQLVSPNSSNSNLRSPIFIVTQEEGVNYEQYRDQNT